MADDKVQSWEGEFRILALDGGGIKGLFSAAVLAKLEEKCNATITDHFDLITGTSTGGIIAIGLGLGLRPLEIVEFYVKQGPCIFGNLCRWRWLLQWIWRKFPQDRLMNALRDPTALGDRVLGTSSKRLVIPSYNLGADKVRVFKTPHHTKLTTDWRIPAWQVALATSAAPTYFPACTHIQGTRLIDGGVWANNPSMLGVVEAIDLLGADLSDIKVLSVGTTDSRKNRSKTLNDGGILQWLRKKDVLEVMMRRQSVGVNGLVTHLLKEGRFHRIDTVVPDGIYALDNVTPNELLADAEDTALHFSPTFRKEFMDHRAAEYKPLHSHKA
jgi:patatin-like phospholipase/acyl hydrolase